MGNLEVSNLLIVESKNDKYFIEALIKHLNLSIKVDEPICSTNEYECLGGIGNLISKLESVKSNIEKHNIDKIGIIFDADDKGIDERTKTIEDAINTTCKEYSLKFKIYIINIDGKGELETILKKIASQKHTMADCSEEWNKCCLDNKKQLTKKN